MDIGQLLSASVKYKASDLHLQAGSAPLVRLGRTLSALDAEPLTAEDVRDLVDQITDEDQRGRIASERSAQFAYAIEDVARFRVNVFQERQRLTLTARVIPWTVKPLTELGFPPVVKKIGEIGRGLVLVTGTSGSGVSTTLAAIVDHLNRTRRLRIITIEDPIEFVHAANKSLIAQREVGSDAPGFAESLREALRQDPDVLLVGDMRDGETMRAALHAAGAGHTVFAAMHAPNTLAAVQRVLALFPLNERDEGRTLLAENLEAVIGQRLANSREGQQVPVVEILRNTPAVRKALLEDQIERLPHLIAGREFGMQPFDQHLAGLYIAKAISGTEALRLATDPEAVGMQMQGIAPEGIRWSIQGP